jgi:sulfatase maturation enzyme AslB (radical SAM superfamily)
MSIDTAKKSIDWIFENIPSNMNEVEIDFIGGEPLLEFDLIKEISNYIFNKGISTPYILFASTNGTLLNKEMKAWFSEHKERFWLGLSLDGSKETHDYNRNGSFDMIDIDYFLKNWPEQGVKMTLSEFSLYHLAENIKYLHQLGFSQINGVNLFEGNFDWSDDKYIEILIPQFVKLVDFYLANEQLKLNQMFDKNIEYCESRHYDTRKWCGIGNGTNFFDEDCYKNCYIYPICPTCSGANYMVNKNFKERNKSKCRIQKLIALFIADLQGKRLLKDRTDIDDTTVFHMVEAIKRIRELYFNDFKHFF